MWNWGYKEKDLSCGRRGVHGENFVKRVNAVQGRHLQLEHGRTRYLCQLKGGGNRWEVDAYRVRRCRVTNVTGRWGGHACAAASEGSGLPPQLSRRHLCLPRAREAGPPPSPSQRLLRVRTGMGRAKQRVPAAGRGA
eukprot:755699-Hanusia_phi.AAC.4